MLDNLPAGTYTVTETNPNGYLSTTPDSVTIAVTLGSTQTVSFGDTLPPTPTPTRVNAPTDTPTPTNTPLPLGQICTLVYHDQNINGQRNVGEPLLNNALVTIQDSNGVVVGTRITNGTEPYCVSNLPSGNYTLLETDPSGLYVEHPESNRCSGNAGDRADGGVWRCATADADADDDPATGTLVLTRVVRSERKHGA